MSTKLSAAARASIRSSLSSALDAARTPMPVPAKGQIGVDELVQCVRIAIRSATEYDARPQRPMTCDSSFGFERLYREYQHRSDLFSCFLAGFAGAISADAPEVCAEIQAFLTNAHNFAMPTAATPDTDARERNTPPCQQ